MKNKAIYQSLFNSREAVFCLLENFVTVYNGSDTIKYIAYKSKTENSINIKVADQWFLIVGTITPINLLSFDIYEQRRDVTQLSGYSEYKINELSFAINGSSLSFVSQRTNYDNKPYIFIVDIDSETKLNGIEALFNELEDFAFNKEKYTLYQAI